MVTIYDKESDQWETPEWLYNELNREFNFKYDLCCNIYNCKSNFVCKVINGEYIIDYLTSTMNEGVGACFMNPPYSNPLSFIKKAYEDSKHCTIACLIKCDPSTKTWGVFWDYSLNKPKPGIEVRFLPKRLKFERGGVPSKNTANFPCCIVVMNRKGVDGN